MKKSKMQRYPYIFVYTRIYIYTFILSECIIYINIFFLNMSMLMVIVPFNLRRFSLLAWISRPKLRSSEPWFFETLVFFQLFWGIIDLRDSKFWSNSPRFSTNGRAELPESYGKLRPQLPHRLAEKFLSQSALEKCMESSSGGWWPWKRDVFL